MGEQAVHESRAQRLGEEIREARAMEHMLLRWPSGPASQPASAPPASEVPLAGVTEPSRLYPSGGYPSGAPTPAWAGYQGRCLTDSVPAAAACQAVASAVQASA